MKENFYQDIPAFSQFLDFTDSSKYVQAPEDWLVVITDVAGSTKAIGEGKYKTVNMVGASCIAAVVNAIGDREIPFVFGGDGATVLIPKNSLERVKKALLHSQKISAEQYGLILRVGIVPHAELLKAGSPVNVGRYEQAPGVYLAFFKGNGLSLAEKWVKDGKYNLAVENYELDFDPHEGLSCRWAPIMNQRGLILSILIKPNEAKAPQDLLKRVIHEIDQIADLDHHDSHPVKPTQMKAEKFQKAFDLETKSHSKNSLIEKLEILGFVLGVKLLSLTGLDNLKIGLKSYKIAMRSNSDFRKYDETLRMVIDCSEDMKNKIEGVLKIHADRKELFYGLFASKSALMTCFVQGMQDDEHVHFIDGGDGGYAMAAVHMKEQIKNLKNS